jgi:hypothetical protein
MNIADVTGKHLPASIVKKDGANAFSQAAKFSKAIEEAL